MPGPLVLDKFLPYRLSITTNLVSDVIAGAYRSLFGLSIPEWRLVAVLAERSQATQLELGAATRMDKVTVSRASAALTSRALVERTANKDDRRSHRLSLTKSGRALYGQVAPKAIELEERLLAGFSPKEVENLQAMLMRLESAAHRMAE
ncbi:MarR family winged helix-turn-helix transcriptional regulator [Sphingosinicella rhizophila]|uniref:MarR family transcriptional regulator n=1 Tax=Sphingosinicella rhizophila TaxID=3050082 RepID=A0ABU3QBT4_9SPHN|nr:MarR family transcriptional regulator [Sphingosinicella sp. GR2756]MDT9600792.1 MarR family transcriptional regulator [Sphingosinicella sp. GR2756]